MSVYSDYSFYESYRKIKRFKPQNVIKYTPFESNLINLNWDSPETYIDSIVDNYKNLGIKPSVSIISSHKDSTDTIYVYVMYGSLTDKCYKDNKIKHVKNCRCSNIIYEKFSVNSQYQVMYYNNIKYSYTDDLSDIVLKVVKHYSA
jgi:hypothetical protein